MTALAPFCGAGDGTQCLVHVGQCCATELHLWPAGALLTQPGPIPGESPGQLLARDRGACPGCFPEKH